MDTKDLRFFRQVYEERSIHKASKLLFITPQGLSKIIRHLEEELGTCLFERLANGMVPTESGTYLYENSTPLLEQFDEIMIGLRQIQDRDQKLKIGFSCGVLNVFPLITSSTAISLCNGRRRRTRRSSGRSGREAWISDL